MKIIEWGIKYRVSLSFLKHTSSKYSKTLSIQMIISKPNDLPIIIAKNKIYI